MTVNVSLPPTVVVSAAGTQGPRGNSVLSGAGTPASTVGIDGDWYIDNTNPAVLVIYGPKASGAWGTGQPIGGSGGGGAPSGPAGGALAGTYPNPSLANSTIAAFDSAGAAAAALTAAKAYTDAHSGGSIRTASVRITDDNLSGLPVASSWTIVVTSGGTPLKCSIPAAVDDRILIFGDFMYNGSHFLDWGLLDSGGAIALYDTSGTSTPSSEGNPTMYPSLSFSKYTTSTMFTIGAGNLNAGLATVALAHQGSVAGVVYAHALYPWRVRLHNIGPEPT